MSRASDKDEKQAAVVPSALEQGFAPFRELTTSGLLRVVEEIEVAGGARGVQSKWFPATFLAKRVASRRISALYDTGSESPDALVSGHSLQKDDTVVLPFVPASAASVAAPVSLKIEVGTSSVSEDAPTPKNEDSNQLAWGVPCAVAHRLSASGVTLMPKQMKEDAKRSMSEGAKITTALAPLVFQA